MRKKREIDMIKASELIGAINELVEKYGDLNVLIHDNCDGCDIFNLSAYADIADNEEDESYLAIGIDSNNP